MRMQKYDARLSALPALNRLPSRAFCHNFLALSSAMTHAEGGAQYRWSLISWSGRNPDTHSRRIFRIVS